MTTTADEDLGLGPEIEPEKLTDWENEPKLADLKGDLEKAANHHDAHVTDVITWLDNLNVTGSAKITKVTGRSTIVPKLIRKQAEWRYASLSEAFLSNDNIFKTDPETWEDSDAAVQNGIILNNQFNTKIDKVAFIDEYIRTGVDEGSIVVRTGWDFKEKEVEEPNLIPTPIQDPELYKMVVQAIGMLSSNPEGSEQLPPELLETVELSMQAGVPVELVPDPEQPTKTVMKTVRNQPTVDVCEYNSCIIDPTCKGKIDKAQFIIYKFETSLDELKKEGKYKNLDLIQVDKNAIQNADDVTSSDMEDASFNFKDKPRKKFIAYEYWGFWDKDDVGTTKPIVGTWVGDTLIRMDDSPFPDEGLPFTLIQYLPKRKAVYGEPDGELLTDNQKISGAVTRGMMDIMGRSAAGQTGVRKDALDVTNQRKYDTGKDYTFNAHVMDARTAFHTHDYPEISQSAQFMLQLQNNEAESLTGVKAFAQSGISGEGLGRSATAARSAIDAAAKRELGILRRLAKGVIEIGRKIMAMNAVFLEEEEIVRVTNEEFVTIKRDDLAGRVDVKLDISTAETDEAKAQELAFMLQTMGNSMPMEMSQLVLENIARLRKMPELAKRIKEFEPQPDPMQQRIQELEAEKLEAEIEKIRSEAEENRAEAELDRAKAGEAKSKTDKTDLDFVEQSSGVTHGRNLEQDGAQAQSQLKRDIVNAALKGGNESTSESTS